MLETKLTDGSQSRIELSIGPDKTQPILVCKAVGPLSPLLTSPVTFASIDLIQLVCPLLLPLLLLSNRQGEFH